MVLLLLARDVGPLTWATDMEKQKMPVRGVEGERGGWKHDLAWRMHAHTCTHSGSPCTAGARYCAHPSRIPFWASGGQRGGHQIPVCGHKCTRARETEKARQAGRHTDKRTDGQIDRSFSRYMYMLNYPTQKQAITCNKIYHCLMFGLFQIRA